MICKFAYISMNCSRELNDVARCRTFRIVKFEALPAFDFSLNQVRVFAYRYSLFLVKRSTQLFCKHFFPVLRLSTPSELQQSLTAVAELRIHCRWRKCANSPTELCTFLHSVWPNVGARSCEMESPAAAADFISVPLSNLSAKAGVTDRSSGVGSVDTGNIPTTSPDS